MRGHTTKHRLETFLGAFYDATVYTSGGILHTVVVENNFDGAKTYHTFRGKGARDKATALAERFAHATDKKE